MSGLDKWLAAVVSVATVWIGIWQYSTTSSRVSKEPFLRQQLNLCFEASETVAKLATAEAGPGWIAAWHRFWELYWGQLAIVEDPGVEAAMVEFGRGIPAPPDPGPLPRQGLSGKAIKVSLACRELI